MGIKINTNELTIFFLLVILIFIMSCCSPQYHLKKFEKKGGLIDTTTMVTKMSLPKITLSPDYLDNYKPRLIRFLNDSIPHLKPKTKEVLVRYVQREIDSVMVSIAPVDTLIQLKNNGSVHFKVSSGGYVSVLVAQPKVNLICPDCPFINWGALKWWQWLLVGIFVMGIGLSTYVKIFR